MTQVHPRPGNYVHRIQTWYSVILAYRTADENGLKDHAPQTLRIGCRLQRQHP